MERRIEKLNNRENGSVVVKTLNQLLEVTESSFVGKIYIDGYIDCHNENITLRPKQYLCGLSSAVENRDTVLNKKSGLLFYITDGTGGLQLLSGNTLQNLTIKAIVSSFAEQAECSLIKVGRTYDTVFEDLDVQTVVKPRDTVHKFKIVNFISRCGCITWKGINTIRDVSKSASVIAIYGGEDSVNRGNITVGYKLDIQLQGDSCYGIKCVDCNLSSAKMFAVKVSGMNSTAVYGSNFFANGECVIKMQASCCNFECCKLSIGGRVQMDNRLENCGGAMFSSTEVEMMGRSKIHFIVQNMIKSVFFRSNLALKDKALISGKCFNETGLLLDHLTTIVFSNHALLDADVVDVKSNASHMLEFNKERQPVHATIRKMTLLQRYFGKIFIDWNLTKRLSTFSGKLNHFFYTLKHKVAFLVIERKLRGFNTWEGVSHDSRKLWQYLFSEYSCEDVHVFHRMHSKHHDNCLPKSREEYINMIIDWECARYTKKDKPLNAYETMEKYYPHLRDELVPLMIELGLLIENQTVNA